MFYQITNAIRKVFIYELQDIIKEHPKYKDTLVINKYQDQEREKVNIIIKNASATGRRMSLDQYATTIESYSTVANLKGIRGDMLTWVKDDVKDIQQLVAPGYYIIKMLTDRQFEIEQILVIQDEYIHQTSISQTGDPITQLRHNEVNPGSESIIDQTNRKYVKEVHYTIDYALGIITWLIPIENIDLKIDYQYLRPSVGPFDIEPYRVDTTSLPGVALAFGDELREGDMQVVIVTTRREPSTQVTTGRWNMNLDIEVRAQDTDTAEKLIDYVASILWATRKIPLADRGITITDISLSGESEEQELDTPDEYSFSNTLSLGVEVDWEYHIPLTESIRQIYIKPPLDEYLVSDEERQLHEQAFYEAYKQGTHGVILDKREGRFHDFGEGSGHYSGLRIEPIISGTVTLPRIYL